MPTTYIPHGVTLSQNQRVKLAKALEKREPITIRLSHSELTGPDELMLTKTQIKRINKSMASGKGVDLKISKTQMAKVVQKGGSLWSSLLSAGTKLIPYATGAISKVAPALATGALSALGSLGINKIFGEGQRGGFLIPQDKIDKLIANKRYLTKKQKEEILAALQSGGQIIIRPTPKQSGGFLGTLLASIGVPLLLNALTGKGLQNRQFDMGGHGMQNRPAGPYAPLFLPPVPYLGKGEKKSGKGLLLGKNSPFNGIPLLGAIL